MTKAIFSMAMAAVAIVGCCGAVVGQERKVSLRSLPQPVRKTVEAESQGATIKGISRERENGRIQFELETVVNGHSRDLIIDPSGTVLEVEEAVELSSLPEVVQTGVRKGAGEARILVVEALSKRGTLTAYEVRVQRGTRKSEFQVAPSGDLIPRRKR